MKTRTPLRYVRLMAQFLRYPSVPLFQEGTRLDQDSTMLLLRQMMVIGCEPGKVGVMSTGAAPLDPIFWVLHGAYEKAQHILQLSPSYRDTFDFTWVNSGTCDEDSRGGKFFDRYPFTGGRRGVLVHPSSFVAISLCC